MAAQDAELKLKVSLDLAFFRQQLAGLGQAAAGYNMPINVKLDRSAIAKELRNLERAIGKKKINVELNLLGGLTKDQLEKIQGRLEALSKTKKVEIPVSVKNGATGRDIQDAITGIRQRIAAHQQIRQGSGKLRIPTSIKPSITNADVSEFKKAVQQKLSGISVKVKAEVERGFAAGPTGAAGLFEYMRSQGLSGGNVPQATKVGRSERLKKALNDLTVKQLQALAKEQGIGGVSRMRKDPLIEKLVAELNQDIAENILGNIKNQLRDVGKGPLKSVLDTFARGLFNMLGMDAASMRQQMAERRALPPVSFPATIPPRSFPIGPSSTGRVLPAGRTAAGLIGAAQAPAGLLPSITARSSIKSGVDALFAAGGPQFPMGASGKLALSTEALRARVDQILSDYFKIAEVTVKEIFNPQDLKRALNIFSYLPQALKDAETRTRQARVGIPSAQGIAGLLPAARGRAPSTYSTGAIGGETREQMMARRTAEAYARSALRGMDVMGGGAGRPPSPYSYAYRSARPTSAIVPYAAGGAMVPVPSMAGGGGAVPPSGGGGGGFGGLGGFGRAMGGVNLPGAGTIRELGSEFAFATKQVLLFGQAYKMLAFIQDFPAQVGQAVSELQSFRNTLNAVATSAEEASISNQFILDLVEKFNVPIESARQGFVKLYASMAPAGFSGEQIRELFTGISKVSATLGLSADKVDRVTYAFAQMASKGQLMSEEVTGQLGDVIPGALSIMAEAAGMELAQFKKAMEDGMFVGDAFAAVMSNVPKVLESRFGKGAEGAADTFQGAMNDIRTSLKLFYESFEPLAAQFMTQFVSPLSDRLKELTDGFTAFFTGTAAKTAGGSALAQQLQQLKPSFDGIRQNLKDLLPLLTNLGQIAVNLGKVFIELAGSPLAGYLVRVYATVLPLVAIIKALNLQAIIPLIASTLRAIPAFVAFNAAKLRLLSTNKALQLSMQLTGSTAAATAGKIRMVGLALGSLVAPAILLGIGALIERFMMLKGAVDGVAQSTKAMLQSVSSMANSGAVAALRNVAADTQKQIKTFESLRPFVSGGALGPARKLTPEAAQKMQEVGLGGFLGRNILGQQEVKDFANASKIIEERLKGLRKTLASTQEKLPLARRIAADIEAKTKPQELVSIPEVAAEGGAAGKAGKKLGEYDRSQLTFIQQQFEKEKQILDKRLQGELISQTQYDIALAELKLETEKLEIAEKYRLAVEKTNKDNLSAADKALKLKDLEIAKNNDLAIADENRNIAIGAARQKILAPILSELDNETAAIERQTAQANALKEGRLNLSAAQEAELSVKERYLSLSQDERELAKGELEILRQIREQRLRNAEALQLQMSLQEKINETRGIGGGLRAGFFGQAAGVFERAMFESDGKVDYATQMANLETAAMQLRSVFEGLQSAIGGVSEAFANVLTEGVAGMIAGTTTAKEVFADFLQSVGQSLLQAASQMIATYIAIGIAKAFAGLGGGGGGESNLDVSGFKQYPIIPNANGNVLKGGFQAFANGGVVTGPTLGLIGEGKYNEAVVPLPDGRSIPVQLGGRSARDMMGSNAPGMPQTPSLSMKFETTKINGVEYVSREQLEQAMAETRRASIAGGAKQGMSMTLDKIKQSPSTRSSIGIR